MLTILRLPSRKRRNYGRKLSGKSAGIGCSFFAMGMMIVAASVILPPIGALTLPLGLVIVGLGVLAVLTAIFAPFGEVIF